MATPLSGFAQDHVCAPAGGLVRLPAVPEASGVAAGEAGPLFAINDSGTPLLTLLDRSGRIVRQVRVTGARLVDWEDVSVGPCDGGSCVYVADTGDNRTARPNVSIVRMRVPDDSATAVQAETFTLVYPDGPHDAEASFVTADGQIFIVTKEKKRGALYRVPTPLRPGGPAQLVRVADIDAERVTDADTSPDGRWTALRANDELLFFRTGDLIAGKAGAPLRVSVRGVKEPQGEGVTFGTNGTVYLVGEGGGRGRAGTFATLQCQLPPAAGGRQPGDRR